jgi:hypothetical protein
VIFEPTKLFSNKKKNTIDKHDEEKTLLDLCCVRESIESQKMRKFDPWPIFFKREWKRNWPFLVGFAVTGTVITKFSLGLTGKSFRLFSLIFQMFLFLSYEF